MSARRYAVAGHEGSWRYVGQAWWVDDQGRRVEHDHMRMVRAVDGMVCEVWVPPSEVTPVVRARGERAAAGEVSA